METAQRLFWLVRISIPVCVPQGVVMVMGDWEGSSAMASSARMRIARLE